MSIGKPRTTNRSLDLKAKFFNILPQDIALPIIGITGFGFMLYQTFKVPGIWCIGITFWLGSTYWIFIGDKAWKYLARFIRVPTWTTARRKHHSILSNLLEIIAREQNKNRQRKSRKW